MDATSGHKDADIDEKDGMILDALFQDASLSTYQISKRTRIPVTTIHNRIKKLKKQKVIKRYTIQVDHAKLGRPITVVIMLEADYSYLKKDGIGQHELARKILTNPLVERVTLITGEFDLLVLARVHSIQELDTLLIEKLRNMDGVGTTRTMVVLSEEEKVHWFPNQAVLASRLGSSLH